MHLKEIRCEDMDCIQLRVYCPVASSHEPSNKRSCSIKCREFLHIDSVTFMLLRSSYSPCVLLSSRWLSLCLGYGRAVYM